MRVEPITRTRAPGPRSTRTGLLKYFSGSGRANTELEKNSPGQNGVSAGLSEVSGFLASEYKGRGRERHSKMTYLRGSSESGQDAGLGRVPWRWKVLGRPCHFLTPKKCGERGSHPATSTVDQAPRNHGSKKQSRAGGAGEVATPLASVFRVAGGFWAQVFLSCVALQAGTRFFVTGRREGACTPRVSFSNNRTGCTRVVPSENLTR